MVLRSWRRVCWAVVVLAVAGLSARATAGARPASPALAPVTGLTVDGAVSLPTTYSPAQLAALPQTRVTVPAGVPGGRATAYTGVSLETLVNLAQPLLPKAKNALLRVTVDVRDQSGRVVTFALGELDASFGDHPAYLVLARDGVPLRTAPGLLVPGDTVPTRSLDGVVEVTVSVQSPPTTPSPSAGAITVHDGSRAVVLSGRRLALLPAQTLNVAFGGPGGIQHHTETGPVLSLVLAVAGIPATSSTWVAAVGSDGYAATVTPAEATAGGRPLILSLVEDGGALAQPRLVAAGDVKGGRYVSDVTDLYAGQAFPLG